MEYSRRSLRKKYKCLFCKSEYQTFRINLFCHRPMCPKCGGWLFIVGRRPVVRKPKYVYKIKFC